jgi:hypothetical protein
MLAVQHSRVVLLIPQQWLLRQPQRQIFMPNPDN